jgi:hypothetical protein
MALREWEVFFFGTAKRMGGSRSSNERRGVVAGPHARRDESGREAMVFLFGIRPNNLLFSLLVATRLLNESLATSIPTRRVETKCMTGHVWFGACLRTETSRV